MTGGVLVVDKPAGPTSFDVVQSVRRLLRAAKAGHTGTLDPLATGVLAVCVDEAVKLQHYLTEGDKEYEAEVAFGAATDTEDAEGSELNLEKVDKDRFGVIYGSGIGGMKTLQEQHFNYFNGLDPHKISPFFVPMMISDIAAGQISIRFGLKGPNYAPTSPCATASHAIADAFFLIQRGSVDLMMCGGSEAAITEISIGGFNSMKALSTWKSG